MITTQELTKYLKIHENTVYEYIKLGMPHYKIGKNYRFELEEVKQWLKEQSENKKNENKNS